MKFIGVSEQNHEHKLNSLYTDVQCAFHCYIKCVHEFCVEFRITWDDFTAVWYLFVESSGPTIGYGN